MCVCGGGVWWGGWPHVCVGGGPAASGMCRLIRRVRQRLNKAAVIKGRAAPSNASPCAGVALRARLSNRTRGQQASGACFVAYCSCGCLAGIGVASQDPLVVLWHAQKGELVLGAVGLMQVQLEALLGGIGAGCTGPGGTRSWEGWVCRHFGRQHALWPRPERVHTQQHDDAAQPGQRSEQGRRVTSDHTQAACMAPRSLEPRTAASARPS